MKTLRNIFLLCCVAAVTATSIRAEAPGPVDPEATVNAYNGGIKFVDDVKNAVIAKLDKAIDANAMINQLETQIANREQEIANLRQAQNDINAAGNAANQPKQPPGGGSPGGGEPGEGNEPPKPPERREIKGAQAFKLPERGEDTDLADVAGAMQRDPYMPGKSVEFTQVAPPNFPPMGFGQVQKMAQNMAGPIARGLKMLGSAKTGNPLGDMANAAANFGAGAGAGGAKPGMAPGGGPANTGSGGDSPSLSLNPAEGMAQAGPGGPKTTVMEVGAATSAAEATADAGPGNLDDELAVPKPPATTGSAAGKLAAADPNPIARGLMVFANFTRETCLSAAGPGLMGVCGNIARPAAEGLKPFTHGALAAVKAGTAVSGRIVSSGAAASERVAGAAALVSGRAVASVTEALKPKEASVGRPVYRAKRAGSLLDLVSQ